MCDVADGPQRQPDDFEALARARFGELSEAERKLLRAAPAGGVAWCGPSAEDNDPANDPAKAEGWGGEREIRAELIRWLSIDREAASRVDPRGIWIHAARITGSLDLSFATVPFPLALWRCRLMENADLTSANIPFLHLSGSWTRSITADAVNVAGAVFLGKGFTAEGEVRLLRAQIGSNLECDGSTFKNPGGTALNADGTNVTGDVFLRKGSTVEGVVRLPGAKIGGNLECDGSTFKNPGGKALNADGMNVTGDVFLRNGFTAEGEVRLLGAEIGGSLYCSGGTFKNPGGKALNADRMNVTGSVFLRGGFAAEGEVRLPGAQIGGNLECRGGTFSALNAHTAIIKGNFIWGGVRNAEGTQLDMTNASAGAVADDEASWPKQGNLTLDGFTYTRISAGPSDANTRMQWLARMDRFTLQPYRQLAKVLRETGDDYGAREVLFEMERRRRAEQKRNWLWHLWSGVLRWTIGYGQMPGRALVCLLGLMALGFAFSYLGYFSGAMAPTEKEAYAAFEQQGYAPSHYPPFHALVYSLEHSFPFVNLGQKEHWTPDPQGPDHFASSLREVKFQGCHGVRVPYPGALRWWFWIQVLVGWLLATLFVAGLTGIVRSG